MSVSASHPRLRRALMAAPIVLVVALSTILVAKYALSIHIVQPDEVLSLWGSRYLDVHFPAGLWDWGHITDRGLERMTPIVLWVAYKIGGGATGGLVAQRIADPLLYSLAAVPAYALARGIGLRRGLAILAGILAVATPWAVFGTSWLNTAAAYGTTTFAVWAMWRAVTRPSVGADVLAVIAVLLAGTARVGNLALGVALPIAVLLDAARVRQPGRGVEWRRIPARIWRRHPLLVVIGLIAIAYAITGGTHRIGGAYALDFNQPRHVLPARLRFVSTQLAWGTGIVPMIVGGAWLIRQVVRPTDARAGAFAVLAITSWLALVYVSSLAGPEERYIAPVTPLLMVAFVAALARREVGWLAVAALAVVLGRAMSISGLQPDQGPFTFFAAPAGQWFHRVVLGRASLLPGFGGSHLFTKVFLVATLVALAVVLVPRRRPRFALPVAAAAAVAVGGYGAAAAVYSMHQFSTQAGYPAIKWSQQAWVDERTGGRPVAILDYGSTGDVLRPWWNEVSNFNTSIVGSAVFDSLTYGCCGRLPQIYGLHQNVHTGAISTTTWGVRHDEVPQYLMSIPHYVPYGLEVRKIASSTYTPVEIDLVRRVGPLRLTYSVAHATYDGYLAQGKPATVRVFRPVSGAPTCLDVTIREPDGTTGVHVARVGGRRVRLDGVLPKLVSIKLGQWSGRRWQDISIRSQARLVAPDGRKVSAKLDGLVRKPCP
jgi:hypothetical protein